MDCKIIKRLLLIVSIFYTTQLSAIEFKGEFLQGHYIIGITNPSAKIIVEAQIHLVFINSEGKPVKIPDEIYSKFKPYFCDTIKT